MYRIRSNNKHVLNAVFFELYSNSYEIHIDYYKTLLVKVKTIRLPFKEHIAIVHAIRKFRRF